MITLTHTDLLLSAVHHIDKLWSILYVVKERHRQKES